MTDHFNVFGFATTEGIVKAHSFVRIKVNFTPTVCGNYYERVYCIVRNHKVLFVDLMGTCFDILTKPVPLTQKHVDAFRAKVVMGTHRKFIAKKKEEAYDPYKTYDDSMLIATEDEEHEKPHLDLPVFEPNQTTLHKEML